MVLQKLFMKMEAYISKGTPKMENVMVYGHPTNQMEPLKVKSFLKMVKRFIKDLEIVLSAFVSNALLIQ